MLLSFLHEQADENNEILVGHLENIYKLGGTYVGQIKYFVVPKASVIVPFIQNDIENAHYRVPQDGCGYSTKKHSIT